MSLSVYPCVCHFVYDNLYVSHCLDVIVCVSLCVRVCQCVYAFVRTCHQNCALLYFLCFNVCLRLCHYLLICVCHCVYAIGVIYMCLSVFSLCVCSNNCLFL